MPNTDAISSALITLSLSTELSLWRGRQRWHRYLLHGNYIWILIEKILKPVNHPIRVQSSIKVYGLWHSRENSIQKISPQVAVSSIKSVVILFSVKTDFKCRSFIFHVFWFWWNLKFFRISNYKSDCGPIKWSTRPRSPLK